MYFRSAFPAASCNCDCTWLFDIEFPKCSNIESRFCRRRNSPIFQTKKRSFKKSKIPILYEDDPSTSDDYSSPAKMRLHHRVWLKWIFIRAKKKSFTSPASLSAKAPISFFSRGANLVFKNIHYAPPTCYLKLVFETLTSKLVSVVHQLELACHDIIILSIYIYLPRRISNSRSFGRARSQLSQQRLHFNNPSAVIARKTHNM